MLTLILPPRGNPSFGRPILLSGVGNKHGQGRCAEMGIDEERDDDGKR